MGESAVLLPKRNTYVTFLKTKAPKTARQSWGDEVTGWLNCVAQAVGATSPSPSGPHGGWWLCGQGCRPVDHKEQRLLEVSQATQELPRGSRSRRRGRRQLGCVGLPSSDHPGQPCQECVAETNTQQGEGAGSQGLAHTEVLGQLGSSGGSHPWPWLWGSSSRNPRGRAAWSLRASACPAVIGEP